MLKSNFQIKHFKLGITILMVIFPFVITAASIKKPTFNYESGKYNKPISVLIECPTVGSTIYYTTDGSIPDENSKIFTGAPLIVFQHIAGDSVTFSSDNDPDPIDDNTPLLYRSAIIKAMAMNENMEKSEVATVEYVIDLVETTFYIPYDDPPSVGGDKHKLDIYQPLGKQNNPVMVFVYGGAWKQGDKNIYMELGNTFAGYYNITTVVINYELSTDPWYAVHPEHIQDVAKAFAWVYNNIKNYGGDPENIFLFGQSAGAHLVSLLATDTNYLNANGISVDKIKGVISMSGAYDLYDLVEWPNNPIGLNAEEVLQYKALCLNAFGSWDEGVLDAASPSKFIKTNMPPFRIISLNEAGDFLDMPGFVQQARNFFGDVLGLNGPSVELTILNESDIPPEIVAIDFPGNTEGHYEEIYAINTRSWNSVSSQMVAEYIQSTPPIPTLEFPDQAATNVPLNTNLSWQGCDNTIYYHLQISSETTFETETIFFDSPIADTTWTISNLSPSTTYYWRVRAVNALGESEWSAIREFQTTNTTGVTHKPSVLPDKISLNLYPNPFNGVVKIQLNDVQANSNCQIEIYDILGKKVFQEKADLISGRNTFSWQPQNNPTGLYLINVNYEKKKLRKKVMYVK